MKVTVPVGVPATPELTKAVNVTDCPASEGFTDEVTAVVVAGFVKFAVTDCACDMVTVVLAEFGLATLPVQLMKVTPALAVAFNGTTVLAAKNARDAGVTVPPPEGETAVINWNWVPNVAVYVVAADGVLTECEIAPASDQLVKTNRFPGVLGCGVLVAMVCEEPMIQVAFTGLGVATPPSTETVSPVGAVVIVIGTEPGLMVVESLEVSFAALISPPPATVTLLVTEAGALAATLTVSVIVG